MQTFQVQLDSPSGSVVPAGHGGSLTQVIHVTNPQKVWLTAESWSDPVTQSGINYCSDSVVNYRI